MRKKYNYKQLEIKLLIKYYTVLNSIMVNLFNHFFVSILPHLIQSNVSTFEPRVFMAQRSVKSLDIMVEHFAQKSLFLLTL